MVEAARRRVEKEAAARHARLQESLRMEERLARHAREWTTTILPDWNNMRRVEKEAAARHARLQESLRMEERLARHAREWTTTILPDWNNMKNAKRTLELWWSGLPPAVRGKVWQLAIENKLKISEDLYQDYVAKAKQKLNEAQMRRKRLKVNGQSCCCKKETDSTNNVAKSSETKSRDENITSNGESKDEVDFRSDIKSSDKIASSERDLNDTFCSEKVESFSDKAAFCSDNIGSSSDKPQSCSDKKSFNSDKKEASKTDNDLQEKPRLSLPRNFSEQNLKSQSIQNVEPKKCCSKSNPNLLDYSDECSMELIQLDIARTFPHLCIFQPGGPYFDVLHELLAAYVCYRPDIGYIQGMSFIAAVLILNMEAPSAFVCFANLLDGPVLRAAFTRDGAAMQRLWKAYTTLLRHNLPSLADAVAPELYLLEWLYTAFAKAMPLDAACRVWDVFLRDGDTFLFQTALGILHLYQDELKDMDFISAAQFLTKLPDDLDPEALFKSIASVSMTYDGMSFEELAMKERGSLDDDVTVRL
ncbi:rab-GTPase-TBC domain-containing protein [Phthorimaea operculella]|nr:rab-GTPase-TBC domain-containing protein [Phthorimaea operculella]